MTRPGACPGGPGEACPVSPSEVLPESGPRPGFPLPVPDTMSAQLWVWWFSSVPSLQVGRVVFFMQTPLSLNQLTVL